jgi:NAD(P)-dependent dehydrogenase (short-subunit alcohol dehydrogenase family)
MRVETFVTFTPVSAVNHRINVVYSSDFIRSSASGAGERPLTMYNSKGRGVLVTGAAGDIGFAIAAAFLGRGARVHITDVDADRLDQRRAHLSPAGAVTASTCDLADIEQVAMLAADATARLGRVDFLVNNAAVQAQGDLDSCPPELFDLAHAINVRAPYLLAKLLVPEMRAAGGGAIVNVASVHATAPGPKRIAYATSKTALLGLTRALATDLGRDNIRVNAVSPGATLTGQLQAAWDKLSAGGVDVMAHAAQQHPLGRIADAGDVAEAVVYLAEAGFINGIEVRVDGGLLSSLRLLPPTGP